MNTKNNIAKIIDDRTIHVFDKSQFDPKAIRNCGQIFLDFPCEIIEQNDKFIIKSNAETNAEKLYHFFDLQTDYNEIKAELCHFKALQAPISHGSGIRILFQDFKPCVISFIVSANNNIKRFSKTLAKIDFSNLEKYTEKDFQNMGCGYRSPYLVTAISQLKNLDFDELKKLKNDDLRRELLRISGVGRKVADCIMLFAFHRLDVAPVDTWIKKAIQNGHDFSQYGRYAGVAQQYVFYALINPQKTN